MRKVTTIEAGKPVYVIEGADEATVKFARAYATSRRTHEWPKAYAGTVLAETVRQGFVGSGEWVYRTADGSLYRVWATANSRGFWGTDYHITREA